MLSGPKWFRATIANERKISVKVKMSHCKWLIDYPLNGTRGAQGLIDSRTLFMLLSLVYRLSIWGKINFSRKMGLRQSPEVRFNPTRRVKLKSNKKLSRLHFQEFLFPIFQLHPMRFYWFFRIKIILKWLTHV